MNGKRGNAARLPGDPGYNEQRFCRALTVASAGLAAALLVFSGSLWLLGLVALLPAAAVAGAFVSGGEIALGPVAGTLDTRPTAVLALWLPAVALAAHAYLTGFNLLQPETVLWAGLIGGVFSLTLLLLADPIVRYSLPRTLTLVVPAFLYAAGLAPPLDVYGDLSPPLYSTSAQVLDRVVTTGPVAFYGLRLAAWGPMANGSPARVTRAVYDRAQTGQLVCVALHRGALMMKWFDVSPCL